MSQHNKRTTTKQLTFQIVAALLVFLFFPLIWRVITQVSLKAASELTEPTIERSIENIDKSVRIAEQTATQNASAQAVPPQTEKSSDQPRKNARQSKFQTDSPLSSNDGAPSSDVDDETDVFTEADALAPNVDGRDAPTPPFSKSGSNIGSKPGELRRLLVEGVPLGSGVRRRREKRRRRFVKRRFLTNGNGSSRGAMGGDYGSEPFPKKKRYFASR